MTPHEERLLEFDYDKVAHRYDRHRGGGGPYLDRLIELASAGGARRVLEIGAGTGNNTVAFAHAFPCSLIALEPSAGMIANAQAKDAPGHWLRGSALHIPLAPASVDFVFAVYVLHYIHDLDRAFRECARVLRGGTAAFVTASHEFIDRHPMNRYFTSFAGIDKTRFQTVPQVLHALADAGFTHTGEDRYNAPPRPIDHYYAERVAHKFISTYDLLPPGEFETGLARLQADLEGRDALDTPLQWEATVVWGYIEA